MSGSRNPAVLLALDFGLRRVGVATGNLHTRTASPLTTLEATDAGFWRRLDRVVEEWQPGRLVVGLPVADEGSMVERVQAFAAALGKRYQLPVETVDEDFTSHAARAAVKEGRRSGFLRRRIAKDRIDRRAACLIAEQWMNEQADGRQTD